MLRLLAIAVFLSGLAPAAMATPVDSYRARLSNQDHYNSSGTQLTSAAAIIRQDRANFYIFGIMDPEDEADSFFNDKANRAKLEKMLIRGKISDQNANRIINGTPLIKIDIHTDHIEITIEED